jgi:hypothetical protein
MDLTPDLISLGTRLATAGATNGAILISDRIRTLKSTKKDSEVIAGLEELVREMVDEKAELLRIAQSYRQELTSQELTSGDVQYIVTSVIPLLEDIFQVTGEDDGDGALMMEKIKPILSTQTINILQLLGFDFRKAIGEPLTELLANMITSPVRASDEVQEHVIDRDLLAMKIAQDPAAFERFKVIRGINED